MCKFYAQKMSEEYILHVPNSGKERAVRPLPKQTEPWSPMWLVGSQRESAFNWEFIYPLSVSVLWFKKGRLRNVFIKSIVYLERSNYPNLFIWKLRKLNSIFFIIQHFIHNKYKLFTATVKKAHLHRGTPSEPGPVQ